MKIFIYYIYLQILVIILTKYNSLFQQVSQHLRQVKIFSLHFLSWSSFLPTLQFLFISRFLVVVERLDHAHIPPLKVLCVFLEVGIVLSEQLWEDCFLLFAPRFVNLLLWGHVRCGIWCRTSIYRNYAKYLTWDFYYELIKQRIW